MVWNLRLAELRDAEAFAKWTLANPQIDPAALRKGSLKQNPTCVYFVVEKDGVIQMFAPLYAQLALAFLSPNPEASAEDCKQALQVLTDGVSAFAVQLGVREITTLSKEKYPIARWALSHGFDLDPRQTLTLDLNKQMESK